MGPKIERILLLSGQRFYLFSALVEKIAEAVPKGPRICSKLSSGVEIPKNTFKRVSNSVKKFKHVVNDGKI